MDFVFAKNMEVATLDTVPEKFRSFYSDKGDGSGFKVDVENPAVKSSVEIITGLHSSLTAARTEAQGLKGKSVDLTALGEYGADVSTIAEGVQNTIKGLQDKISEAQKGGKVNVDKIKEEIAAQFAKDLKAKDSRNEALTGQLYTLLVENSATDAIVSANGESKLLMPFIKDKVRVVEEDGKFNVYVVDGKNDRRYSGTTGQALSVAELVNEMKGDDAFSRLFNSDSNSGGGSNNTQTNTKQNFSQKKELSATEKISLGLNKGQHQRGQAANK